MLISEEYRDLNAELHERNERYGTSGGMWAKQVMELVERHDCETILDYGCGKETLSKALPGLFITGYDPAIPALAEPPEPHDLVVCGDVLEHIEPDCIMDVLDDLRRLTLKVCFMTVAMIPANKTLADGRNAHILLRNTDWWLPNIMDRWILSEFRSIGTVSPDGTENNHGMFYCTGVTE